MTPEEIGRILDELGERIGPAGEYAWATLVTGKRIVGIVDLVIGLFLIAVTFAFYRGCRWAIRKHADAGSYDSHDLGAFAFGAGAVCSGLFALFLVAFAIPNVLLPEYGVLRDLIGGLR